MLELKLLGIPKLILDGETVPLPSPKILGLLGYLAVQSEARTRKELLELFWHEGKSSNVRFALFKLRDLPRSEDWLETTNKFVKTSIISDVRQFEEAVSEGRFADALAIWHRDDEGDKTLLKGLDLGDAKHFMNWLELERSRLEQLYLTALQKGITELEQKEQLEDALDLAHLLLEKDKLNESAHRAIMRLEHRQGNTEAALAQFEGCRQVLKDELGVEPLDETLELLREIEDGGVSSGKNAVLIKTGGTVPARPEKLVGRTELIGDALSALQKQKRVLLHGFGGAGKTALAAAVAETYLNNEKDKILWLQAGDDAPDTLFDALARAFEAQQHLSQAKAADKTDIIKELLSKNKLSLFVLDDVWNAYALSKVLEAVPEDIPLLVTSRQRYPKIKRLDVGRLARKDGLRLLSHHIQVNLSTDADADKLCETLGDHAFALRIAGINLQVDELTPTALLKQITDAPHRMKTPPDFAEEGRESVTALLTASLNALPEDAYEAFMGFGVLFTTSSTPELLSLCTRRSEEEVEEALFTLQKRGLAERVSEPGSDVVTYRVHDLAYSFARANNHFRLSTAQRACKAFLKKHVQDFDVLDADITNLLGATQAAEKQKNENYLIDMMKMLVVGNAYFGARGHTPRSFELLKMSVNAAKILGDLETAHHLVAKLGNTYRDFFGDLTNALASFKEALKLARQMNDHHREATLLTVIGIVRFHQNGQDADTYFDQAQNLAEKHSDDIALSQVLEHQAYVAGKRADWVETKLLYEESILAMRRLQRNPKARKMEINERLFFALLNLGEAERKLDCFDESLKLRKQALEIAKELNHQMWIAYALQEIGEMYHDVDNRNLAQENYQKAIYLYEINNAQPDLEALTTFMRSENYSLSDPALI